MEITKAILILLAGCGVFIAGMNMLGNGLEKSAGGGMKKLLGKISGNRFAGVGIGAGATAIIQSSSATSVMVIGFVNAGVMTLFQAAAIIMGANIGTTITGVIVAFSYLKIVKMIVAALAFVGVMMMFFKNEKLKQVGGILCGFGLIFVGLDVMGGAFENYPEITAFFQDLFSKIDFPLLLVLLGAVFTAILQSSSAATGIFITMVGTGALGMDSALFLVLGSNIGTCVTALLACMGAGANAKRTALIHLIFNVVGSLVFTVLIWIFREKAVWILGKMTSSQEMQLAWFHVIFNVATTLMLLPFIKQLVWIAEKVIPDKKAKAEERKLKFVDERLLKTPSVAIMQVKKEVEYMAQLAKENLQSAFETMDSGDETTMSVVAEKEKTINFTNHTLTRFLIRLSPLVDTENDKEIGTYFHVLNDLERIGDHAENFAEIGVEMRGKNLEFSATAKEELKMMQDVVLQMFELSMQAFVTGKSSHLEKLTELENEVDGLKKTLTANHYSRLAEGACNVEHSPYFSSSIVGLERVADHLVNFGYSVLNPVGSQSEARRAQNQAK